MIEQYITFPDTSNPSRTITLQIIKFTDQIDISSFCCGVEELNHFLLNESKTPHFEKEKGTFFITQGNCIVGYFTLSIQKLNISIRSYGYKELNCFHLDNLAIASAYHRKKIATAIMITLIASLNKLSDSLQFVRGFSLNPKTVALESFYQSLNFEAICIYPDDGLDYFWIDFKK